MRNPTIGTIAAHHRRVVMGILERIAERGFATVAHAVGHSPRMLELADRVAKTLEQGKRDEVITKLDSADEYRVEHVEDLLRELVDDLRLLQFAMVTTRPGCRPGGWHYDGGPQGNMVTADLRRIIVSVAWPIGDFTVENGATEFYEFGSQHSSAPTSLVARNGDAVVFLGSECMHRRGPNRSTRARGAVFLRYLGQPRAWLAERIRSRRTESSPRTAP